MTDHSVSRDSHEVIVGIFGRGGCGRDFLSSIQACIRENSLTLLGKAKGATSARVQVVWVDPQVASKELFLGLPIWSEEEFLGQSSSRKFFCVTINESQIRKKVSDRCLSMGVRPLTIVSPLSHIGQTVQLGEGGIVGNFVNLSECIEIGRYFHANVHSYVSHDCKIGDYVTLAPGAKVNGNIVLEDHVYVGSGAVIKQGREGEPLIIGAGALIGMGAVVTRSVAPGQTVVGNPARALLGSVAVKKEIQ